MKKSPRKAVKKILKLDIYKQSKPLFIQLERSSKVNGRRRTFCIMGQRVSGGGKLKPLGGGVVNTSSRSTAVSCNETSIVS